MGRGGDQSDSGGVELREVVETDLPIFFEHQADEGAAAMVGLPSRGPDEFWAHWHKHLGDPANVIRTVLWRGEVAGNVLCFPMDGRRWVGYWLGREFWGRGIATTALELLLDIVDERPLHAAVSERNAASIRVLGKCGFERIKGWTSDDGELTYRLGSSQGSG